MRSLAAAIITIAAELGGPRKFRKSGGSLRDFLDNRFDSAAPPEELAAEIVGYFCADDSGRYNQFQPGVMLAVKVLDKCLRPPTGDERMQSLEI